MSVRFDPSEDWRDLGLRRVLVAVGGTLAATALFALLPSYLLDRVTGTVFLGCAALALVCVVAGLWPDLSRAARLTAPVISAELMAFLAMCEIGFAPGMVSSMLALVVVVSAFTSMRASFAVVGLTLANFVAVGQMLESGSASLNPENPFVLYDPGNLLREGLVVSFAAVVYCVTIYWLIGRLTREEQEARHTAARLRHEHGQRLRAEEARSTTERALAAARETEAVGRLAGGIAHDFNNQLQIFLGWTGALLGMSADRRRKMLPQALHDIASAAEHSAALSRQLAAMGTSQPGGPGVTECAEFVRQQLGGYRRLLPADIEITFEGAGPSWASIDEGQLQQVLTNLIVNARDAMPEGGNLDIEVSSTVEKSPIRISLRDTGHGMDQATMARAFEPFFTTKGSKGTGLGLANVYGIVHSAGGDIEVESQTEKGSTFILHLPPGEPVERTSDRASALQERRSGTILVVDDREDVRSVLAGVLTEVGYRILQGADTPDGLKALESEEGKVDLLCTDAIMPGPSVLGLVEAYQERFPEGKVLICSGYIDQELLKRGIRTGEYAFMAKPFDRDAFLAKVDELLS